MRRNFWVGEALSKSIVLSMKLKYKKRKIFGGIRQFIWAAELEVSLCGLRLGAFGVSSLVRIFPNTCSW